MSISVYIKKNLEKYKNIQVKILHFLENEENIESNIQNLELFFEDKKIGDCQHEFRLFLHLILTFANNYHRSTNFFNKIERILQLFKDNIKKCPNSEIFNIFKSNKRILLFLIEENILSVDKYFIKQITKGKYLKKKYPQYFAAELKPFVNEKWFPKYEWVEELKKELPDNFSELRNKGENDSYLCELIREDLVEEFVTYVNSNCIPRNAIINPSIYETSSFIINKQIQPDNNKKNEMTLIEYAAFFGSIQIFLFLKNEGVELTPTLWINAIHGKNADLIHLLEDYHVEPIVIQYDEDDFQKEIRKKIEYLELFKEAIKCHHNDIANYFLNNYLQNKDGKSNDVLNQSIKYYNFYFIQNGYLNESSFCSLCRYDYYSLVNILLSKKKADINQKIIKNYIFE